MEITLNAIITFIDDVCNFLDFDVRNCIQNNAIIKFHNFKKEIHTIII
jgi:hypothetical protein